jgi:hypothetical protein
MRSATTKAASSLQWRTGARDRRGSGLERRLGAAQVDRAGPRAVPADHKPGLVHPDVDWPINYLASTFVRSTIS